MQDRGPIGIYTLYDVAADGTRRPVYSFHNDFMASWGYAAARALGLGDAACRINAIYIEFENVDAPETVVSTPTFDSKDNSSNYYSTLATPRDYMRVPVVGSPRISVAAGYEACFAEGEGNQLSVYGQTTGVVGVHNVPFDAAMYSKVYGLALVAAPVWADASQDIVLTRGYHPAANQLLKSVNGQVGVGWSIAFIPPA